MRHFSDKEFEWRPGNIYIPANHFTGLSVGAVNEAGSTNNAFGALWAGAGAGAPISKEVSTFGFTAVLMETAADAVDHCMRLPYDMDVAKDIAFRVHWTSGSATTADTIDWKVFYLAVVPDSTTLATADGTLTTAIAQDTVIGAYTSQVTAYGTLKGGTLSQSTEFLTVQVEMDAFAAGLTEDKFFLGLEIAYSPKRLRGPDGMAHAAKRPTYMLSNLYS